MANVESKKGEWIDLGKFKSIKCKKIGTALVCQAKFKEGKFTLTKEELDKICEEQVSEYEDSKRKLRFSQIKRSY